MKMIYKLNNLKQFNFLIQTNLVDKYDLVEWNILNPNCEL